MGTESLKLRKKLIEVALPLEAINAASGREKSIRHGHPSTLHLWWARRPLAAARAVIFSQMVDDPSSHPEEFPTEEAQGKERQRLFRLIEQLVQWENTTNEDVLTQARAEIWRSWRTACLDNRDHPQSKELFSPDRLPGFHDPFAGGGALPLEAQRLGLEAYASDLNPVAVLINKAMIEIPPKFTGRPPVNPDWQRRSKEEKAAAAWSAAQGLAADVRYYGKWMRAEAEKRIGKLYPKVGITAEMAERRPDLKPLVGETLTVIAWLWARTVKSPNPAFRDMDVPLVSSFMLSTKPGREAYLEPVFEHGQYRFAVRLGKPKSAESARNGTKMGRGANFRCLLSGEPIEADYIRAEAAAGRLNARMMVIVAEGPGGRVFLEPRPEDEALARKAEPAWKPDLKVPTPCHDVDRLPMYGMPTWGDAFTARQLVALVCFSDLVTDVRKMVARDAMDAGCGSNSDLHADAVALYLSFAVDRVADRHTTIATWDSSPTKLQLRNTFARQAIPMTWDYGEGNPLCTSSGAWAPSVEWVAKAISFLPAKGIGQSAAADASSQAVTASRVVSTDPPYYDNIGYADLSDFFYVWLRRILKPYYPELFATVGVPKSQELVATPYRHGSKEKAEAFFLDGMTLAMRRLAQQAHPAFPCTIYYAFKQSEDDGADGTASTGWETFLDAVVRAGFGVDGTWPMRTELGNRMIGKDTNALASSIVLVCRQRAQDAPTATRRELIAALKAELPCAMDHLRRSNIAPVDFAQAAIGPGMAVYTRYSQVLDAEGRPLRVRDALALINEVLDEVLAEQEGDFDADSRWALSWFEHQGFGEGKYGEAETLATAKNTSVSGLVEAGFLSSGKGKVRLLKPTELPKDWDPEIDQRLTVWEMVHHLIRALDSGEKVAAQLVKKLGASAEVARELAYRLYALCERKKRAQEALAYNALVQSWPEISRLARETGNEKGKPQGSQTSMFDQE